MTLTIEHDLDIVKMSTMPNI